MINLANIPKRYFKIGLPDNTELEIEAPSIKTLKDLEDISRNPMNYSTEQVIDLIANMLSKNKKKISFQAEQLEELWDSDQMAIFITSYLNWVRSGKQDPN